MQGSASDIPFHGQKILQLAPSHPVEEESGK
jgi:hypothetical protein